MYSNDDAPLNGMNIYRNKKGQVIYYDRFRKNGYIISPEKEKQYRIYSNRLLFAVLAVILIGNFFLSWRNSFFVGVILYILLEVIFRFRYLPSCTSVPGFVPEKRESLVLQLSRIPRNKIITKILLFIALGVLLILNAAEQNYTDWGLWLSYGFSVASFFMSALNVAALLRSNKEK